MITLFFLPQVYGMPVLEEGLPQIQSLAALLKIPEEDLDQRQNLTEKIIQIQQALGTPKTEEILDLMLRYIEEIHTLDADNSPIFTTIHHTLEIIDTLGRAEYWYTRMKEVHSLENLSFSEFMYSLLKKHFSYSTFEDQLFYLGWFGNVFKDSGFNAGRTRRTIKESILFITADTENRHMEKISSILAQFLNISATEDSQEICLQTAHQMAQSEKWSAEEIAEKLPTFLTPPTFLNRPLR